MDSRATSNCISQNWPSRVSRPASRVFWPLDIKLEATWPACRSNNLTLSFSQRAHRCSFFKTLLASHSPSLPRFLTCSLNPLSLSRLPHSLPPSPSPLFTLFFPYVSLAPSFFLCPYLPLSLSLLLSPSPPPPSSSSLSLTHSLPLSFLLSLS